MTLECENVSDGSSRRRRSVRFHHPLDGALWTSHTQDETGRYEGYLISVLHINAIRGSWTCHLFNVL